MAGRGITEGTCALLRYTLCDHQGRRLQHSGAEPVAYVHGQTRVVAGLFRALDGRGAGECFEVTVTPEDGYGPRDESVGPQPIPRGTFPEDTALLVGMEFDAETPDGQPVILFITDVTEHAVFVDSVHPFAGKVLVYSVEVIELMEPIMIAH